MLLHGGRQPKGRYSGSQLDGVGFLSDSNGGAPGPRKRSREPGHDGDKQIRRGSGCRAQNPKVKAL